MSDQLAIHQLLDRPIAYHPVLADLVGSVEAAIMLSQALYWQKRCKSDDGYWYTTREDWYDQTRLRRYAQEQARAELRRHPWWKEERRGVPAQLHYRVDIPLLLLAIAQMADGLPTSRQAHPQQVGRPSAGLPANHRPANTETPKDSSETTTTAHSGGQVPWPELLTPEQREACARELRVCPPEHKMDMVHELANRLARTDLDLVRMPHLWLRALIAAVRDGKYVPPTTSSTSPTPKRDDIEARYRRLRAKAEAQIDARRERLLARQSTLTPKEPTS